MKRSLYSLILSDEVVARVDMLADKTGTNRSHLIDEILAEHVELTTPAKHTRKIFEEAEKILDRLDVNYAEHDNMLSVKSELDYRYRPTIRYDVEMGDGAATLAISYRTRSTEFDSLMTRFFELWEDAEKSVLSPSSVTYSSAPGRWERSITLTDDSMEHAGKRVSNYVKTFDTVLKKYMSGNLKSDKIKDEYVRAVKSGAIQS